MTGEKEDEMKVKKLSAVPEPEPARIHVGVAKKEIRFELTIEEQADRGHSLGLKQREISEETALQTGLKSGMRAKLGLLSSERDNLAEGCANGTERRRIWVDVMANHQAGAMEYLFEGNVVGSRPMTMPERQMDLAGKPVCDEPVEEKATDDDDEPTPLIDARKEEIRQGLDDDTVKAIAFAYGLETVEEADFAGGFERSALQRRSVIAAIAGRREFLAFAGARKAL